MMNWLKGLASFAVSGASTAATGILYNWSQAAAQAPGNPPPLNGTVIGIAAAIGGIVGLTNYMIKSPLQLVPKEEEPVEEEPNKIGFTK